MSFNSKMLISFFSSILLSVALVSASVSAPAIVNLGYAQYQGIVDSTDNQTQFLGVRYASPPLGKVIMNLNTKSRLILCVRRSKIPSSLSSDKRIEFGSSICVDSGSALLANEQRTSG